MTDLNNNSEVKITKFVPKSKEHEESIFDIVTAEFDPIRFAVDGFIPEGLTVLAGAAKLGKSFLAYDLAVAVASGTFYAMGKIKCDKGAVLYYDLENGKRTRSKRMKAMGLDKLPHDELKAIALTVRTQAPKLNDGFIPEIEAWRKLAIKPKMVIIDVFQKVKPIPKGNQNAYESDYAALAELQTWASVNGIAVVIIHHIKKGNYSDDPIDAINGSNGIGAAADTILILARNTNGATLYVRGREIEENESALQKMGNGYWELIGNASEVFKTDERKIIIDELNEASEPLKPQEIADLTGMKSGNVRRLLGKMVKDGDVQKTTYGKYSIAKPLEIGIDELCATKVTAVTPVTVAQKPLGLGHYETVTAKDAKVTVVTVDEKEQILTIMQGVQGVGDSMGKIPLGLEYDKQLICIQNELYSLGYRENLETCAGELIDEYESQGLVEINQENDAVYIKVLPLLPVLP